MRVVGPTSSGYSCVCVVNQRKSSPVSRISKIATYSIWGGVKGEKEGFPVMVGGEPWVVIC